MKTVAEQLIAWALALRLAIIDSGGLIVVGRERGYVRAIAESVEADGHRTHFSIRTPAGV